MGTLCCKHAVFKNSLVQCRPLVKDALPKAGACPWDARRPADDALTVFQVFNIDGHHIASLPDLDVLVSIALLVELGIPFLPNS